MKNHGQYAGVDLEQLVNYLKEGWTLSNRGPGWYLQPRRIPCREQQAVPVADAMIRRLERRGIAKVERVYISAHVRLCGQQEVL
jgi:hypothetical protein